MMLATWTQTKRTRPVASLLRWGMLSCFLFSGASFQEAHACSANSKARTASSSRHDQTWRRTLEQFLEARRKAAKSAEKGSQEALTAAEYKRWKSLLPQLKKALPQMSLATLEHTRRILEIESDRDRNRFFNFPQSLSMKIIRSIVAIDLRRGAYKKPAPRQQWRSVRVPGKAKKPQQSQKAQDSSDSSYAMGDAVPSPQSLLKDTTPPVDASKLPTLVFTQRDLDRYQTSKSLIGWPMAKRRIGSGYGWRRDPFTKKLRKHSGIDIGAPHGTPVWAAADGYVWRSGWLGSCGLGVLIRHNKGMMTYYCHLSQILAPVGRWVRRGELIGKVGSTGRSTSPHLHFSLVIGGRSVDPEKYLP